MQHHLHLLAVMLLRGVEESPASVLDLNDTADLQTNFSGEQKVRNPKS